MDETRLEELEADEDSDTNVVPFQAEDLLPGKRRKKQSKAGKRSVDTIMMRERQRSALELRKAGANYVQIGEQLGVSPAQARRFVINAMEEVIQEPAAELMTLQLERLQMMLLTLWPRVNEGDTRAIDRALMIMDKMDRYHGLGVDQVFGDVHIHNETVNQETAVLVIEGDTDNYIAQLQKMAGAAGVPLNELPRGTSTTGPGYVESDDSIVVDAELID